MLYDNVNDYWEAKRKRDEERARSARRQEYVKTLIATQGMAEVSRQAASGELVAALEALP